MYTLRPYQQQAVNQAYWHIQNYGKPFIIQAATGAGKSLIIAELCKRLNQPVLILQPSKELLIQNFAKLKSYGITEISKYSASVGEKAVSKFTYATIGSIYKKPELFAHFKYVIIDECHGVNPKNLEGMYTKFLTAIGCTNVCGLTATPYRIVSKFVKQGDEFVYTAVLRMINRIHPFFFKKIAFKIETRELINQGFLCPIDYISDEADLSELVVNTTGADFTADSVDTFWNTNRLKKIAQAIGHIDANHKRNLIFCSSVRQAEKTQDLLDSMGIDSGIVTAKTKAKERDQIVQDFRDGNIKHLINVGVFTTGFDIPKLDSIILARPTMSLALYYQMVGRGVRIDSSNPNKRLTVYDFAGVTDKFGKVENIRLAKEVDGFRDKVVGEHGTMTERILFEFKVTKKEKVDTLNDMEWSEED